MSTISLLTRLRLIPTRPNLPYFVVAVHEQVPGGVPVVVLGAGDLCGPSVRKRGQAQACPPGPRRSGRARDAAN
jgi:hypothetical protein